MKFLISKAICSEQTESKDRFIHIKHHLKLLHLTKQIINSALVVHLYIALD